MRVIAGPEKKTRVMSEKERRITAYHEMGHALVGHYLEHSDPVHKISVIGRGQALGYTISMPQEDKFLTTRAELQRHDGHDPRRPRRGGDRLRRDHHRRVQRPREGHRDGQGDGHALRHERASLGPRVFGHDHGQPFLGREFSSEPDYSDEIAREIDDEIRRIVESAHQRAKDILDRAPRAPRARSPRSSSAARRSRRRSSRRCSPARPRRRSSARRAGARGARPARGAPTSAGREAPRPLPRPGLAGGGVEARGLDLPEKPELA